MSYQRRALTAAMVQINLSNMDANFGSINESRSFTGAVKDAVKQTIARARSCSTNESLPFARLKQIGYGTIVEDVPLFTEASGQLSMVESIDIPSLYRLGIHDFVGYLMSCNRTPLEIAITASCNILGASGTNKNVDTLKQVRITNVARVIDVDQQIVINSAAFIFIRPLEDAGFTGAETIAGVQ